jgi:hypothetical protein
MVEAQCPSSIQPLKPILVEVVSPFPHLVLRILSRETEALGLLSRSILRLLPLALDLRGLWEGLVEEWSHPAVGARFAQGGGAELLQGYALAPSRWDLDIYLERIGILLEALMTRGAQRKRRHRDLKSFALQILPVLEEGGGKIEATRSLLDLIRGCQAVSLLGKEDGRLHLYLPLLLPGFTGGEWGDVEIEGWRRRSPRRGTWSFRLRLELQVLGPVRVEGLMDGTALRLDLLAMEEAARRTILMHLPHLRERLKGIGLKRISCRVHSMGRAQEPVPLESLLREGVLEIQA